MRLAMFTLTLTLAALTACDDALNIHAGGEAVAGDDWCAVQEVFAAHCLTCHSAGANSGGLDLETDPYATLIDQPSVWGPTLVVPSDRGASFLYNKVIGAQTSEEGGIMPLGSGLDETSAETIGAWIDGGATEDCGG